MGLTTGADPDVECPRLSEVTQGRLPAGHDRQMMRLEMDLPVSLLLNLFAGFAEMCQVNADCDQTTEKELT